MSIRSLMSAAHAAGFAMAVTEVTEDEYDDAEAHFTLASLANRTEATTSSSHALVVRMPELDRASLMRDWLQGFRARVTA